MSAADMSSINQPDPADPLGLGLVSIRDELQRQWLIGAGNPYVDAEVRISRSRLVPVPGFASAAEFMEWVVLKWSNHGHETALPFPFTLGDKTFDNSDSLTQFHYRNTTWPVDAHELPGGCCPTDPLFVMTEDLAVRFRIDQAQEKPGFAPTSAVVEYSLLNRWRR